MWCVIVEEMDKNDEELRESIVKLWPIQGPKMNTVLVPPKEGILVRNSYVFSVKYIHQCR